MFLTLTAHKRMIRSCAVATVSVALLSACSSDDDDDSGSAAPGSDNDQTSMPVSGGDSDQTSMPAPGADPNETPPALTTYDGDWLLACSLADEEFPEEGYDTTLLTINSDSATSRILRYSDEACTAPLSVAAESVITVSLVYPGGTTQTALGTADHINLTAESVTTDGQPPSAEETTALNEAGFFDVSYDLILLDGNSLYFGDESSEDTDGTSEATRPTEMDAEFVFIRQ